MKIPSATMIGFIAAVVVTTALGQSANDGFDPNVNGTVNAMAVQADGKIIIGGDFTMVGGTSRSRIARLNADGSLDSSFNPGVDGSVLALAVQADGKILVGGSFATLGGQPRKNLGRLNSGGGLDNTFNPGADGYVSWIAVQANGKLVVGGGFITLGGQPRYALGRLNSNGSLDATFAPQLDDQASSLAIQPDGKILVGGWFAELGGQPRPGIGRLNADGTLDLAFAPAIDPQSDNSVKVLAIQADGKILMGGVFTELGGQMPIYIRRLNARGSIDASFTPQTDAEVRCLAIQTDGKILLGGAFTRLSGQPRNRLGRLNPDGSLDPSFDPGASNAVNSLAIQTDGKILVGGSFTSLAGQSRNRMGRLHVQGGLDTTFNPDAGARVAAVLVQADGKILVGGYFTNLMGQACTNLARLNPDGSLDNTFRPMAGRQGDITYVECLAVQSDGKILVGGQFSRLGGTNCGNIGRLNPDGRFDNTFKTGSGASSGVKSIAVQADGKILVAGYFTYLDVQPRKFIGRFNGDGSVDLAFDPGADYTVHNLVVQRDGKILVGGAFYLLGGQTRYYIARLNTNGTVDNGFNPGAGFWVNCLAVQADDKILVGGAFTTLGGQTRSNIGRVNSNGSLDTAFNAAANDRVLCLAVQADGKILVGGGFSTLCGQARNLLGRLNADGSLDGSFDPKAGGAHSFVADLAVQADGKIVVGGFFQTLGGQSRNHIGRLTSGGSAWQSLEIEPSGTRAFWKCGGGSPEVQQVVFEHSTNNLTFSLLGSGTRISGAWEIAGLSLLRGQNAYVRARGFSLVAAGNGSNYITESVRQYYVNRSPIARCKDLTLSAGTNGTVDVSIDNGSSDPDLEDALTLVQTPPGPYSLGTTRVTLTVTDNFGASNSLTAAVTVVDTTPPDIHCPSNILVNAAPGSNFSQVNFTVTATDLCDPNVTVTCTPPSGSLFPVGTTTVQCVATDASGNSNSCSFVVRVNARPEVAIIAPTSQATYVVPQPIVLLASATDPDGDGIARVDYYEGTNWLGTVAPGTAWSWTNTPVGVYQIMAAATDNLGAQGQSAVLLVTNLAQAPFITSVVSTTNLNQSGLLVQHITVKNPTANPFSAVRVLVQLDAVSAAGGVRVWNAAGTNAAGVPYLQYNQSLAPGQAVDLTIEYYIPDRRTVPSPTFTVEVVAAEADLNPTGTPLAIDRVLPMTDGSILVEFSTLTNRIYFLQYSADMAAWKTALPSITGTGSRVQWFDNGPPKTESLPNTRTNRFYRLMQSP